MAQVVNGQVKLNNGQMITPQQGAWYDGQQFWGGALSNPGQINTQSNQVGAGQAVSQEVIAQTNPANVPYVQQQQQQANYVPGGVPAMGASGTGAGAFSATGKPTINLQNVYDTAYKSPEIAAAEKAVSDAQMEIDKQTEAYNKAVAEVNDNPFYSETTRVGKERRLQEKYNADILKYQNTQALAADALAKKQADAQVKVNIAMQQYDIDSKDYQNTLSQFNAALSAGALINASGSDIASYAALTGMSTTMIDNIIAQQKRDLIKPQVITATDDNGNVTIATIDANTGNVINKTSLGSIGNKQNGGKATAADQKDYYSTSLRQDAQSGMTIEQAFQLYTGYLNPDDILHLWNANAKNGPTAATPQQLAAYGVSQPGAVSTNQMLLDLLNQTNQ
jgi:hypothetical protein